MPEPSARFPRPWPPRQRALAAGGLLAGALCTLVGGVAVMVGPGVAAPLARAWGAEAQASAHAARAEVRATAAANATQADPTTPASPSAGNGINPLTPVGRTASAQAPDAIAPRPAPPHDPPPLASAGDAPPPYAPGGDDLLPTGEAGPPAQAVAVLGGSATSASAATPTAARQPPAPRLWLERSRVALGETVVLHGAPDPAASACRGSGLLAGVLISGPRIQLRATVAGLHRLALRCSGPAGAVDAAVWLTVPLPVAPTSAENRQALDAGTARLPGLRQLGLRPVALDDEAAGASIEASDAGSTQASNEAATHTSSAAPVAARQQALTALGDFLQQGRQSLFVVAAGPGGGPWAYVMARDAAGRWVDHSAELLDAAERGLCPGAALALSADFNRDGRPDVWLACPGRQLLFLSQADGRWRRVQTPFVLQAQQAEARDVDGDGWTDIVALDARSGLRRTVLLLGRGDGRFDIGPAEAWRLDLR